MSNKKKAEGRKQPQAAPAPSLAPLIAREPEAAALVGMSPQTLRVLRSRGGGPKFLKLGLRRVGYLVDDLEAWARSRPSFSNTTEASLAAELPKVGAR